MRLKRVECDIRTARDVLLENGRSCVQFRHRYGSVIEARWSSARARWRGDFCIPREDFLDDVQQKACVAYTKVADLHIENGEPLSGMSRLGGFIQSLHLEDLYLAHACSAGIEEAWHVFHRHYGRFLERSSRILTRSGYEADEVLASFYSDLYLPRSRRSLKNALASYGARSALQTWLRSVLFFRVGDYYELASREPEPIGEMKVNDASSLDLLGTSTMIRERSEPSVEMERRLWLADLAGALPPCIKKLTGTERWLLEQHYWRNRSVEDIGRELGVHRATISRRLRRIHTKVLEGLRDLSNRDLGFESFGDGGETLIRSLARKVDLESIVGGEPQ